MCMYVCVCVCMLCVIYMCVYVCFCIGYDGIRETIMLLSELDNGPLIWEYSEWVLRTKPREGLKIFTSTSRKNPLPHARVLKYFKVWCVCVCVCLCLCVCLCVCIKLFVDILPLLIEFLMEVLLLLLNSSLSIVMHDFDVIIIANFFFQHIHIYTHIKNIIIAITIYHTQKNTQKKQNKKKHTHTQKIIMIIRI